MANNVDGACLTEQLLRPRGRRASSPARLASPLTSTARAATLL